MSVGVSWWVGRWINSHKYESSCQIDNIQLDNRVVVVTGANTGIGFHTSLEMARRGATVVMACRSHKRGVDALNRIVGELGDSVEGRLVVEQLDLSVMRSVVTFVERLKERFPRIDVLVNNAAVGIGDGVKGRDTTEEGLEKIMATNHFGPFLLTNRLIPRFITL